jgi:hypothetical protein
LSVRRFPIREKTRAERKDSISAQPVSYDRAGISEEKCNTAGLKVQASHQHAHPTTCRHNDLVVPGRAVWWQFEAASVPNLCQISCPEIDLVPDFRTV